MPSPDTTGTLQRRLDQLRDSLRDITIKLRSAVANAVGQSLGTVVRDTVLRVLSALQEPLPPPTCRPRNDPFMDEQERATSDDSSLWEEDGEQYHGWQRQQETSSQPTAPTRLTVAVCAALEATSAARRFLGKQTILTLLGFGLAAGCMAYWTPTLAIASIGLVTSASHLSFVRRTVHNLFNG